tara:strand:+ start:729 stop:935 length:207 start_codon:yes stop_codon:yes gene_type:complete
MDSLNTDDFLARYHKRAEAVKKRSIPPVGGEERAAFITQAELDYLDFSIIASSEIEISDSEMILKIKL